MSTMRPAPVKLIFWIMLAVAFSVSKAEAQVKSAPPALPADFQASMKASGMVFDQSILRRYIATRVLKNDQVFYSYAIKHRTRPVEVRYGIHRLGPEGKNSDDYVQAPMDMTLRAVALTVVMNMAKKGNPDPEILASTEFKRGDVRAEYGADFGGSALFVPDPTFSTAKTGFVVTIVNVARRTVAFIVFLYPIDPARFDPKLLEEDTDVFYSLKFASR